MRRNIIRLVLAVALPLAGTSALRAQPDSASLVTVITGGNLVDVNSGTTIRSAVVVIEGNRLERLSAGTG